MISLNQRTVYVVALLASNTLCGTAARAQTAATRSSASPDLAQPRVFTFDQLPLNKMANGGESRIIVHGTIATGEAVALHESILPVGVKPNTPHRIAHSEFITVLEGAVAFEHDGKSERVGPGDVIYVAFGTLHTLRNVGDVPAKYMVIAIGGDAVKK